MLTTKVIQALSSKSLLHASRARVKQIKSATKRSEAIAKLKESLRKRRREQQQATGFKRAQAAIQELNTAQAENIAKIATLEAAMADENVKQDRKSTRLNLQSHHDLVCRLLLEKKKKNKK